MKDDNGKQKGKVSKYLLATKNQGKISELTPLLAEAGITITTLHEMPFPDVEETGLTFAANAELKAVSGCLHTGLPTLADDSGLCVDALDGAPGIYTARYGGYVKLLEEMHSITSPEARSAIFCCDICLAVPSTAKGTPEIHHFYGECAGYITSKAQGERGFGYDPVFSLTPEGKTWAEGTPEEKAAVSHRARALAALQRYLNGFS